MAGDSVDYGADVLAGNQHAARRRPVPERVVEPGLVVEETGSGFCGAVVGWAKDAVELEDRYGTRRQFPWGHGYLLEGAPVALTRPRTAPPPRVTRTASGSIAVTDAPARTAREGRLYVEGIHDAELVERVWGDDLRIEGVVVEPLHGVDDLPAVVDAFGPGHGRRLGVLVDHLVDGSKESRIAASVRSPHVLVVGHPYVDIWQAVRPSAVGIERWPKIPPGTPWKQGVCLALGWPAATATDMATAWRRILGSVHSYTDVEPALLGRVEELIDFVTAPRN
ncbi:MAG: DUF3097 domain-containing protein [Nocardioidaceae bacterium]